MFVYLINWCSTPNQILTTKNDYSVFFKSFNLSTVLWRWKKNTVVDISLSENAVITRNKYSYNQRYGTFVPLCVSTGDIEYRYSYITGNYYELMYRKYHHLYLILLERTYINGLFIIYFRFSDTGKNIFLQNVFKRFPIIHRVGFVYAKKYNI